MICKDCLHYEACKGTYMNVSEYESITDFDGEHYADIYHCPDFSNKAEWVKLPCKVGDTVYYLTGIRKKLIKPAIIKEIIFDTTGVKDLFVSSDTCDFENSFDIFYLTQEEAEKALEERRKQ